MEPMEPMDTMSENLRELLDIVENTSAEDILSIPQSEFVKISNILSPEEFSEFMFAKNIKIFGGVNNYANDYFDKNTISKILAMSSLGKSSYREACMKTLNKMLSHPDLNDENRTRINNAIIQLGSQAAPAAGGRSKGRGSGKSKSKAKAKAKAKAKSKSKSKSRTRTRR